MLYTIEYFSEQAEQFVLDLPSSLKARYLRLADLLIEFGPNLGMPRTKALSGGLFELRLKGKEGIARVFYCTLSGQRIVILHGFVKKTQKTPKKELLIAQRRFAVVKENESR